MQIRIPIGEPVTILSKITPKNLANRAALRAGISTVVAVFIAIKLHMGAPFWSGVTTVVVANLYTGKIIDKSILRVTGTFAGAFLGLYIAGFIANSLLLYLLACFLLMFYSVHYYYTSRYAYAFLLGGATAIMVISQVAMEPGNVFYIAIWRSAEISIGIVVSALTAYTIFPNNIHENFRKEINVIFTHFEKETEQLTQFLNGDTSMLALLNETNYQMKKDLNKVTDMIDFMRHESGMTATILDKRRALLDLLRAFARHLNYFIYSQYNEAPAYNDFARKLPIESVLKAIHHDLQTLKDAFNHDDTDELVLLTRQTIDDLDSAFIAQRNQLQNDVKLFYQFRHFAEEATVILSYLRTLLIKKQIDDESISQASHKIKTIQVDLDMFKHNIKAGLSVTLAMFLWLKSEWPGGIDGVISSIVISVRKNIFEMKHVALQRMLGCFFGAGSTLTIMAITALDFYDFFVVLFFLVWAFSYFSFKYTKYAYIGMQANIAIALTLISATGPPLYISPGLERLIGVFIGILATFIVANTLWRTDTLIMLERNVEKLSRLLADNVQQILSLDKKERTLKDATSLLWVCRSLFELLSHQTPAKKDVERLVKVKNQFASLVFIMAIIMQIDRGINKKEVHELAEKVDVDLKHYESMICNIFDKKTMVTEDTIAREIEALKNLEETLTKSLEFSSKTLNFIAYINALRQLARNSYTHATPTPSLGSLKNAFD